MTAQWLITAACGLATALGLLAYGSGIFGGGVLGMAAPIPLFFAGLTLGWTRTLVAGLVASAVLAMGLGAGPGLVLLIALVLPASILVRQALLAQPTADGSDLIWYPVTRLALWLGGIGVAAGIAYTLYIDPATIEAASKLFLEQLESMGNADALPDLDEATLIEALQALLPAAAGLGLVLWLALSGGVAQRLAERTGRAVRPRLPLTDLRLPKALALILGVLILGSGMLPDVAGQVAIIVLMVMTLLFTMQGLAIVHVFARRAGGVPMLTGLYLLGLVLMLSLGPVLTLTLLFVGIAGSFFAMGRPAAPNSGT